MKQTAASAMVSLLLVFPGLAAGAITVAILDAPSTVYSYEPVFVVFEVRNSGREPVLIPVHGCRGQGTVLEVGPRGEPLADRCRIYDLEVRYFAWVRPGDRRLFFSHVALGAEGLFEIEAVVRSPGECIGSLVGPVMLPLPSVREIEGVGPRFECWSGEARSQPILVDVKIPTSEVDLAAAEALQLANVKNWHAKLILSSKELLERFPTSHYTYAATYAQGGAYGVLAGIERQPDNPLNRWAAAAVAATVLGKTRRCAAAEPEPFFDAEDAQRHSERALSAHPPRGPLSKYLEQLALEYAAEECPEAASEKGPRRDGNIASGSARSVEADPSEPPSMSDRRRSRYLAEVSLEPSSALSSTGSFSSTMGFKQRLILNASPGPSIHWLSLPYRYSPEDVGTPGVVDAEDLCQDAGDGGGIAAVLRWNEAASTLVEHYCGAASPFALLEGVGYGIRRVPNWSLSANLAGGHDDAFAHSIPATGGSQLSWLSVPYHLKNAANHDPITAEGLCQQIGSSEVLAIMRWDTAAEVYRAYGCGSAFEAPFPITPGEAFGVINRGGQTISWQPIHY